MSYLAAIESYAPRNAIEEADKGAILDFIAHYGDAVLGRHPIAHLTASAFIVNPERDKAIMVRHKLRQVWSWTGGHADGDGDLRAVALREAREETGAEGIALLAEGMVSLEVLPVLAHMRRGVYVGAHVHLNASYLLLLSEDAPLTVKPDENEAVVWFAREDFTSEHFSEADLYLYNKLFDIAAGCGPGSL